MNGGKRPITIVRSRLRSVRGRVWRATRGAARRIAWRDDGSERPLRWLPAGRYRLRRWAGGAGNPALHLARPRRNGASGEALLVTHDLSASGAPRVVLMTAELLVEAGYGVTVLSPSDGPLTAEFVGVGADVVVDSDALAPPGSDMPSNPGFDVRATLAAACDFALVNTVVGWPAVAALAQQCPCFWYLHEVSLLEEMLAAEPQVAATLARAHAVWAGSELSAGLARPHRGDVRIMPYGLQPIAGERAAVGSGRPLRVGVFGSLELRKGQDLALAALHLLPAAERDALHIECFGRVLDPEFAAALGENTLPQFMLQGELNTANYQKTMLACDAVLMPSRDDTLPLVTLDALGAERLLMCTATVGTSAYLTDGVDSFVAAEPTAEAIAAMLSAALAERRRWPEIAATGRAVFDGSFSRAAFARRVLDAFATARNRA